jgi:hypothetical protein
MNMDAPSKIYGYRNHYYSARLNGDERMYRREHSPLGCDAVRSFWKPREGVSKHCNRQRTLPEKYDRKFPCYWKNQPVDSQKPQRSFQRENPWVQPTTAEMEKAEEHRKCVTTSTSSDKQKQRNLLSTTFKNNMLTRFRPETAASYSYKSDPVKPEPSTAVAFGFNRGAANDLRELILPKRAYRNYKADGAVSAKGFKNEYAEQHNGITSEAVFQTRQTTLKSDYSFQEHRIVSGNKVTLILNRKVDLNNNCGTLTGPVRVGHIKTSAEIRAENNSPVNTTSSCSVLKKTSKVSVCLSQKLDRKNTEAKVNFGSASDGNKFRMPASNPDGKYCLQKTKETTPYSKFTARKSQSKRNNTDAAGGPTPKRRRPTEITFNSLQESKVIVQAPGSNTDNARSDLSKKKDTSCLSTKSANYVLNKTGDNNALNPLSVSQTGKSDIDIYEEELFTGDGEDNDILFLDTDDNILEETDDVLKD